MNELWQTPMKTSESLLSRITIDEEFTRIFENIKLKEKINGKFTSLSEDNKINFLIKAFFIIKNEKGNLFNNFLELENDTKNMETANLNLRYDLKEKEDEINKLSLKIYKLMQEVEEYKMKINDLSFKLKDKLKDTMTKDEETFNSNIENPFYNNMINFGVNRKSSKKELNINKFLNNKVTNYLVRKNIYENIDKQVDESNSKPSFINEKMSNQSKINPLINNLNNEFINLNIRKSLNKNDENFIADYIVKTHSNSNNHLEHEQTEFEINTNSEKNDKSKFNFNSQINQSVSVYESVYASYDNKYNIGEYNSSTYQSINSSNKNQITLRSLNQ